jgi:phosphohistidine phosphatase
MKLLTLLRHAKSDRDLSYATDFERPLKERGRRDAPRMGEYLADLGLVPDLIVSSPAARAQETTELFARASGYRQAIRWEDGLYAASSGELMSVLRSLADDVPHVLLVGHNPGLEECAAQLIGADAYGTANGVRLPTAALAHLELNVGVWCDVQANCGQLLWLVIPRILA